MQNHFTRCRNRLDYEHITVLTINLLSSMSLRPTPDTGMSSKVIFTHRSNVGVTLNSRPVFISPDVGKVSFKIASILTLALQLVVVFHTWHMSESSVCAVSSLFCC